MKRSHTLLFCLAVLTALSAGCNQKESTDSARNSAPEPTAFSAAETAAAEPLPSPETEPQEKTVSQAAETAVQTETSSGTENKPAVESGIGSAVPGAAPENTVIGNTGMTAAQWCVQAEQIYITAARTAFDYFASGSGLEYDMEDCIDGNWIRVLTYDTIEEAAAEYYSVFAQTGHEQDMEECFRMSDGKLYRAYGSREPDRAYQSSQVTALLDYTDTSMTFQVVNNYQEPDGGETYTESDAFTLIFERGVWRVGEFNLPY